MVKSYKLIKEYPHSPKLGFIIKKINPYLYGSREDSLYFNINELIKYKEYWGEVIEKDYEILSFIDTENNKIYKVKNNIILGTGPYFKFEDWEDEAFFEIHSVKRLSDGEIFIIGDKVNVKSFGNVIINKLFINNNNKILLNSSKNGNFKLKDIKHIKIPLFTTEDGVEIFKGDKTCWINNWTITNFTDWQRDENTKELHFSTKEKAEEYILMNKPCLSINDVFSDNSICITVEQLKKIVKSKK